ncbi:MAG: hypothetical protein PHY77_07685 [Desulfotomaculaceae bacterium]|nr:hypothetical protein [Desulfotomaculaceae bacterium]
MTKINRNFYLGSWTVGGAIIIIMLVFSWAAFLKGSQDLAADLYIYTIVPYTYLGIIWLALLYQSWAAIQDDQAAVTPVKAVVFMLIPLFRYYWIFRVFRNYAEKFNAFVNRRRLAVPALAGGLFTAFSILWVTYGILQSALIGTGLLVLLAGAYLVVGTMTLNTLCNGLIKLAGAAGQRVEGC